MNDIPGMGNVCPECWEIFESPEHRNGCPTESYRKYILAKLKLIDAENGFPAGHAQNCIARFTHSMQWGILKHPM